MAHDYTLNTFLRQTPNHLLKDYFARRGVLDEVPFDALKKREHEPILAGMEALDPTPRARIETEFYDIFCLATKAGTQIIMDEAGLRGLDIADQIEAMENHYHRAMWLFLNHGPLGDGLFLACSTIARINELSFTTSKRRKDLPKISPATDDETCCRLAEAISVLYRSQGRGHRCKVEHFLRPDPTRHCYYAWPEDYTTSELQYDEVDLLGPRLRKSVFEVAFVFRPDEGTLEIHAPGKKAEIQALQEVFCRITLGMDQMPPSTNDRCFVLNGLKSEDFAFVTDPVDGIAHVHVVALRMNTLGSRRCRLTVEQDPASGESLHDWLDRALHRERTPLEVLDVNQARIRVEWAPVDSRKPRTLTFTLTTPDSSTLRDFPHHQIVKRYLEKWQIAR